MIFGAIISAGASIIGAAKADSDAKAQRRAQEEQRQINYISEIENWQFRAAQTRNEYDYTVAKQKLEFALARGIAIQDWNRQNALERGRFITESTQAELDYLQTKYSGLRDYQLQKTLQAADYRAQVRNYEQSTKLYKDRTDAINTAAKLAYDQTDVQLGSRLEAIKIASAVNKKEFYEKARQAKSEIDERELAYRADAKERGLTAAGQMAEVNQARKAYTAKRFSGLLEGKQAQGAARATGRQGVSANRTAGAGLQEAGRAIGAMGVQLGFQGSELARQMQIVNNSSSLAARTIDLQRRTTMAQIDNSADLTNLQLAELDRQAQLEVSEANLSKRRTFEEATASRNEAMGNRVLRPMDPVAIPEPTPILKSFTPQPFLTPKPLQATKSFKPFLPTRPMTPPKPRLGASIPRTSSALPGAILSGVGQVVGAFQASQPPSAY